MDQTVSFFGRLREERQRLGMSQTVFGDLAGVTKKTQMLYEGGERSPDANYLSAIAAAGADVNYILTGQRSSEAPALTSDEREMLELFRSATLTGKAAAIGALQGAAGAKAPASGAKIKNLNGQNIQGDQTNTAPLYFGAPPPSKKAKK